MIGVGFDFLAEPPNVYIHAAGSHETLGASYGVEQLVASENAVWARREVIQQTEFERGKGHRLAVMRDAVRRGVNGQSPRLDDTGSLAGWLRAAQQSLDSRAELSR